MKRAMHTLAGSTLASLAAPHSAPDDADAAALKIVAVFADLAGCHDNILGLAHALHDGTAARLTFTADAAFGAPSEITTIEPPTGKMAWNDVKMALMLARDALHRYGIPHPTGAQLRAVLVGGDVSSPNGKALAFRGVLRMRAQGLNWGQIAAERYKRPEVTNRVHTESNGPHDLPALLTENR
jgi:hypothetical protein